MNAASGSLIAYSAAPGQAATDGTGGQLAVHGGARGAPCRAGAEGRGHVQAGARCGRGSDARRADAVGEQLAPRRLLLHRAGTAPEAPDDRGRGGDAAARRRRHPQQLAKEAYEAAERTGTAAAFRLVAEQFPGTFYAALAEEQIAKLEPAAPPEPAGLSAEAAEQSLGLARRERRQIQSGIAGVGPQRPGSRPTGCSARKRGEAISPLAVPPRSGRDRVPRRGVRPDAAGGRAAAAAQDGDAGPDGPKLDQGAEPAVQGVGSGQR